MLTDHHCHILPGIDDGSDSVDTSLRMIEMMKNQGVERIVATPHFYAHREKGITAYLEKRKRAYDELAGEISADENIILGAEVAIEHGISRIDDISKLCITGTNYILLELQYTSFANWMIEEVNEIIYGFGLKPILAHVHRYLDYYSKAEMEEILKIGAVLQFNNEAYASFKERRFVKSLIKEGYPYIFGSDAHNLGGRKPNWDVLVKKAGQEVISRTENIFE